MASSSSISTFSYTATQIPIFDGEHYETEVLKWRLSSFHKIYRHQLMRGLKNHPRQDLLLLGHKKNTKEYKQNVQRNATAFRIIQRVSKSIYLGIFSIKKARKAWEILKNEFQDSHKAISIRLQNLWIEFENRTMKDIELIKDFSSKPLKSSIKSKVMETMFFIKELQRRFLEV